ncbi:MAG: hypothetical protein H7Y07_04405 [Pyrinomonadaceae bacterium]|nr:hypothetical protein [Sphingobacteriaceae bacterium]
MKKNVLKQVFVIGIAIISHNQSFAQVKTEKGNADLYVKTGFGFMQTAKFEEQGYNNATHNYKGTAPFLAVGIETALWNNISVGALFGLSKFHSDVAIPKSTEHLIGDITAYNLFVTVKYHLPLAFGPISTYVHADAIGLTAYQERRSVTPVTGNSLDEPSTNMKENYGIYAGGRYSLGKKLSAFAELGYGYTMLNFGINKRIK